MGGGEQWKCAEYLPDGMDVEGVSVIALPSYTYSYFECCVLRTILSRSELCVIWDFTRVLSDEVVIAVSVVWTLD